jgi:acyl dehydratase
MIALDVNTVGGRLGEELAVSDWIEVTQARIDLFAEATEDRQWIHVDPAKAAADSPFTTTIAHGFLTLSLVSGLSQTAMKVTAKMAINYGLNRVRFIAAVPAGARVRGRFSPIAVDPVGGGIQVTWKIAIELDGHEKPCCIAEWIVRYYL